MFGLIPWEQKKKKNKHDLPYVPLKSKLKLDINLSWRARFLSEKMEDFRNKNQLFGCVTILFRYLKPLI